MENSAKNISYENLEIHQMVQTMLHLFKEIDGASSNSALLLYLVLGLALSLCSFLWIANTIASICKKSNNRSECDQV